MEKHCVRNYWTIKEVMDNLEENKDRLSIVLDKSDKVVGVVSQGDVMRALAAGKSVYAEASKIMKTSFLYLTEMRMDAAYDIFRARHITALPVVDGDFHLIKVVNLSDVYDFLDK